MSATIGLQLKKRLVIALIERCKVGSMRYAGTPTPSDRWFVVNQSRHWFDLAGCVLAGRFTAPVAQVAADMLCVFLQPMEFAWRARTEIVCTHDSVQQCEPFAFFDANSNTLPLRAYSYFVNELGVDEVVAFDELLGELVRSKPATEADIVRLGVELEKLERLCRW